MINAISVDLEDWYHPELLREKIYPQQKCSQVVDAVRPILHLLDRYEVRATFFILGDVMENSPHLIKLIYSKGHEIACHGMSHMPLWKIGKERFCLELNEFSSLVKNILGKEVIIKGYRAPSFSLDNSTKWALEVLKEKGYKYSSSIFPTRNKLYGLKGAPLEIYKPSSLDLRKCDPESGFIEFPLAVCDLFGIKIPVAGGFYFRIIPFIVLRKLLRRINKNRPFVFYLHPWESYGKTPKIKQLSPADYFITYWGGGTRVLRKLEWLLKSFSFKPICEVLGI